MKHALSAVLLMVFAGSGLAQEAPRPATAPRVQRSPEAPRVAQPPLRADGLPNYDVNAPETQQRLHQLLQQFPPSLGQVLALDPTLLTNQAYLEPYPLLAAFLAQHPEVAHNPSYFLPQYRDFRRGQFDYNDPKLVAMRTVGEALGGVAALTVFLTIVATIAWVI